MSPTDAHHPGTDAHAHLVVVRHGESRSNVESRYTGWRDAPLTDRGRNQARAAGRALRDAGAGFDAVFTSRLSRAIETADLLLAAFGAAPPRSAHWQLNERHYGRMQGLTPDELEALVGRDLAHAWRKDWDTTPEPVPPGHAEDPNCDPRYRDVATPLPRAESLASLAARVDTFFAAELRPRLAMGQRLLVVCHGLALRAMLRDLEGFREERLLPWLPSSASPRHYRLDRELRVLARSDLVLGDEPRPE